MPSYAFSWLTFIVKDYNSRSLVGMWDLRCSGPLHWKVCVHIGRSTISQVTEDYYVAGFGHPDIAQTEMTLEASVTRRSLSLESLVWQSCPWFGMFYQVSVQVSNSEVFFEIFLNWRGGEAAEETTGICGLRPSRLELAIAVWTAALTVLCHF